VAYKVAGLIADWAQLARPGPSAAGRALPARFPSGRRLAQSAAGVWLWPMALARLAGAGKWLLLNGVVHLR